MQTKCKSHRRFYETYIHSADSGGKKGHGSCRSGEKLAPGNLILVDVDTAMSNDVTAPVAIDVFEGSGCGLCNKDNVTFVLDHFTPTGI